MTVLHQTGSPISREERNKINENWQRIIAGLQNLQRQVTFLAGGEDVDELIDNIKNATIDATNAASAANEADAYATNAALDAISATSNAIAATLESTSNEVIRQAKEELRAIAEGIRVEAENIRVNNEQARSEAEDLRTDGEQARVVAETIRAEDETIRQASETERIDNEDNRQSMFNNKLEEINIALPNVINLVNAGIWNGATQYYKNNIVEYNLSTFMAKQNNIGKMPPTLPIKENDDWILVVQKGTDGTGSVSSVNGISPDVDGNVELEIGGDVSSVNGVGPDQNGDIILSADIINAIPTSDRGVANGVALLNDEGKVVDADGNLVEGMVLSVSGKTGEVIIEAPDVEGLQEIIDGVTGEIENLEDVTSGIATHMNTHIGNADIHVSQLEKDLWNDLRNGNNMVEFPVGATQKEPIDYYNTGQRTTWENWCEEYVFIPEALYQWAPLLTICPWDVAEYDRITQIMYTQHGIYTRLSIGDNEITATWGPWSKISTFSGSYDDLVNAPTIPTQTSQLTNDSGFITSAPVSSVNGQTGDVDIVVPDTSGFVNKSGDTMTGTLHLNGYSELYSTTGGHLSTRPDLYSIFIITPTSSGTRNLAINSSTVYSTNRTLSFTLIINQFTTPAPFNFPASFKWKDGIIPDLSTPSKTYVLTFFTVDQGVTWLGSLAGVY